MSEPTSSPSQSRSQAADFSPAAPLPTAKIEPRRRFSWAWLLPALAVVFAAWLGYKAWLVRGVRITVQLDDGYGLKAGDDVRYRGIAVGKIDSVTVLPDLQSVFVAARLNNNSEHLARAGSRFWVVRPHLHLTRVEGLETLIGPRYLAVQPAPAELIAHAQAQRDFVGLSQPPAVEQIQPGDLEVILQAKQRGSLQPGAPITYRQTRVGTILSVGLNGDGSAVEARAHIQQPYVQLIRPNTRFWDVGGIQARFGLTGVSVEIESTEALLSGGVALATPPPDKAGGDIVRTGHRFSLSPAVESDWLEWQPMVAIGSSLLPPGVAPPSPLRATIGWKEGRWIKGQRTNHGWVLQTSEGLLGPADLLKPAEKADPDTTVLEIAGTVVPLNTAPAWEQNGLGLLKAEVVRTAWPASGRRSVREPEECLVIADPAEPPLPLATSRLTLKDDTWVIDPAISVSSNLHGACVVSRTDGKLLGFLIQQDDGPRVALLPPQALAVR